MSNEQIAQNKESSVIHLTGIDGYFVKCLLEGNFISYHDEQYEVTSGEHQILMKLFQQESNGFFVLFYLHVPLAYPMPEGVKLKIKSALEDCLDKKIQKIEFINAGTDEQKGAIQFRIGSGGEL